MWHFKDMMDAFLYPLTPDVLENVGGSPFNEIQDRILRTGIADITKAKEIIGAFKRADPEGKAIAIALEIDAGAAGPLGLWVPIVNDFVRVYN